MSARPSSPTSLAQARTPPPPFDSNRPQNPSPKPTPPRLYIPLPLLSLLHQTPQQIVHRVARIARVTLAASASSGQAYAPHLHAIRTATTTFLLAVTVRIASSSSSPPRSLVALRTSTPEAPRWNPNAACEPRPSSLLPPSDSI
jgi:hypothetical protein